MPESRPPQGLPPEVRARLREAARRAVAQNPPRFSEGQLDQLAVLFRPPARGER